MKWCHSCKQSLSESNFYPHNSRKDGLRSECKECAKAYRRKHEKNKRLLKKVIPVSDAQRLTEVMQVFRQLESKDQLSQLLIALANLTLTVEHLLDRIHRLEK